MNVEEEERRKGKLYGIDYKLNYARPRMKPSTDKPEYSLAALPSSR